MWKLTAFTPFSTKGLTRTRGWETTGNTSATGTGKLKQLDGRNILALCRVTTQRRQMCLPRSNVTPQVPGVSKDLPRNWAGRAGGSLKAGPQRGQGCSWGPRVTGLLTNSLGVWGHCCGAPFHHACAGQEANAGQPPARRSRLLTRALLLSTRLHRPICTEPPPRVP